MRLSERLAISATPLFLRLALCVAFVWSGSDKLFHTDEYSPEQAATLAGMGVGAFKSAAIKGEPEAPTDSSEAPAADPDAAPPPSPPASSGGLTALLALAQQEEQPPASEDPAPEPPPEAAAPSGTAPAYTADNFSGPVSGGKLYRVALLLHGAGTPADGAGAAWPSSLASGRWPVFLAWFASVTELAAGLFMLLGFLTRLSALALASTMVVAAWLTSLGPALLDPNVPSFLGLLPSRGNAEAWLGFTFQLALLACALGVLCSGPGALCVDRLLFRRKGDGDGRPAVTVET